MQPRALIAEDEGPNRRFLEEICEASGFEVDAVSDGQPAYILLSSLIGKYDVAFLDIRMPGWSGYDTLSMLEGKENGRKFIVVTSGYMDEELMEYVNKHPNVIKILTKPFGTGTIAEILRNVIISRHPKESI